jgi:predicted unusual protein kinase regulating ubiquinone biosynthesis (AarF/ABC1/UbiB family)
MSGLDSELTRRGISRYVQRALADIDATLGHEAEPLPNELRRKRVGDLVRSSLFLSLQAGLQIRERLTRGQARTPSGWLPRALVMTSVAGDLYLGYRALRARSRTAPHLVRPRDWELQHERGATRILDAAESLGGTLIKACQVASVRGDLLPAAYVRRLASLQDRVPPQPWHIIESAIASEIGWPLSRHFDRIEHRPLAAGSLGQVHRAWLRDGRAVAVKIRYPDIQQLIDADLASLEAIVVALAQLEPDLRLRPVLDHLKATLPVELDLGHEAIAMTRLRDALQDRTDVLIPRVVRGLSTRRMIVMDLVDGIKITDRAGLEDAGIDPSAVARLVNDVYAQQLFELGILHADPHPGNVLVQPGPRLVLLDHGLTIQLSPSLVSALCQIVRSIVGGDFDGLAAGLRQAGFPVGPEADLGTLLELAGVLFGTQSAGDGADIGRRLGQAVGELPVELLTVGRAFSLLSGITRTLDSELDVLDIAYAHAGGAG